MVKYAACYPGQGAQKPHMALDFYNRSAAVRELFAMASEVNHRDLYNLLDTADEEVLQQTEITQTVVTLANLSAAMVLKERGVRPECHAGFSLGELSAYASAQVLTLEDLFRVVSRRGDLMARASQGAASKYGRLAMAAIIGIGFETVEQVLSQQNAKQLYCANDNGPLQVVISGLAEEIDRCTEALKSAGARRVVPLRVSGPFHTPLMADAQQEFAEMLSSIEFKDPVSPLYTTVTGARAQTGEEVRELCVRQLSSPVRWTKIMQQLVETEKVTISLELGPGTVLSGLWKASGYPVACMPAGTSEEVDQIAQEDCND